ncbi:molecular chaperone DnaJ [Bergeyella porcorum]|uniref:Molecular chaperone DnaJ n=1 Tax=Bergeyella porcorum TaxID=1735111 RepID=A0AAU0F0V1_9FLAO
MKFYNIFCISFLFLSLEAYSQKDVLAKPLNQYPQEALQKDEFGNLYYYDARQKAKIYEINGETVVVMDELVIQKKPIFNNQLDKNYYYFINKKLNRVYPLFLTALQQYRDLNTITSSMEDGEKRRFLRQKQEELADQYEAQLRDLTTTEGQVFAKLMNRATGKTVYEIIRELRGGWSAFWWNVKGKAADIELKREYNPRLYREDEFLESLLQSNWNVGYLMPYPGYQDFKVKR